MKAGRLRHRLIFQSKPLPEDQNTFGDALEVWTDAFTLWGAFEVVGSREFPVAHKRFAESTARFRVRYRSELGDPKAADKYRIVFTLDANSSPIATSTWNIQTPMPVDGRRIEMYIEASVLT